MGHRSAVQISRRLTSSQQWGILAATAILITGLVFTWQVSTDLHQQLVKRQHAVATVLLKDASLMLRPALSGKDGVSASVLLQDWVDQSVILNATLYDAEQQAIAEHGILDPSDHAMFWLDHPVTDQEQLIGHLRAAVSLEEVHKLSRRNAALLTITSFFLSMLVGLLAYFRGERQRRQRNQQIEALQAMSENETLSVIENEAGSSDMQAMNNVINSLVRQKQQKHAVKQALKRFMTPLPMSDHKPLSYHNSALLFIEIQGLDELQKRLSADELVSTLNRYHKLLSQAAKLYNGTLDRYQGGGVMMLFGYPEHDPRDTCHCLYAARLFRGLVNELRRTDQNIMPLDFRLAAHWGPVLIAPVGEPQHMQFNLIGDTAHWTARLARRSKDQQVLVSQALIDNMSGADSIFWQEGPLVQDLNGTEHGTYWLDSLPETAELLLDRQVKHIAAMKEEA